MRKKAKGEPRMGDSINLYRYFPAAAAINTIERRQFRVGRILELNDPFEWSFGFDTDSPEQLERARLERDQMLVCFNEKWGILSFCKVVNDPVIWSHYADKHRGIAIKVACLSSEMEVELLSVTYRKKRVCIPFIPEGEREQRIEELRPGFKKIFRYKAPSWRYEQEVRGIVELKSCNVSNGMFWWSFPDGFAKSVIIGLRSTVSDLYIRRALDLNGLGNVEVLRATEHPKTYCIKAVSSRTY